MANSDEGESGMKESIKGTIIIGLLLALLGLMLLNTVWPRQTSLSKESMEGISQVADSMKQSAANWEKIAKSTAELHQVLLAQAQGSRNEINSLNQQLLGRYGLDANDPFNAVVNSMFEQSKGLGGGDVPGSKGGTGPAKSVQVTNDRTTIKVDRSTTGALDNGEGATTPPPK